MKRPAPPEPRIALGWREAMVSAARRAGSRIVGALGGSGHREGPGNVVVGGGLQVREQFVELLGGHGRQPRRTTEPLLMIVAVLLPACHNDILPTVRGAHGCASAAMAKPSRMGWYERRG